MLIQTFLSSLWDLWSNINTWLSADLMAYYEGLCFDFQPESILELQCSNEKSCDWHRSQINACCSTPGIPADSAITQKGDSTARAAVCKPMAVPQASNNRTMELHVEIVTREEVAQQIGRVVWLRLQVRSVFTSPTFSSRKLGGVTREPKCQTHMTSFLAQ